MATPARATGPPVVGGTSFNDAAPPIAGTFSDALDTGSAVFYRVHLEAGQRLDASASLDVGSLDPSLTETSSLSLRLYDPLRVRTRRRRRWGRATPPPTSRAQARRSGP